MNGPVLVTNDDGIASTGLLVFARALERAGFEVIVAAPARDMSGAGAAIGPVDPKVPMRRVEVEGLRGPAFAVQAPPAMIVVAAMSGAFGETPGAVASGINAGLNLGRAILHSGTVGAALTGQNLGVPSVACSTLPAADQEVAAQFGVTVLRQLVALEQPMLANVNVPAGATVETPLVTTRLARYGSVTSAIVGDTLDFQLVIDPEAFDEEGTDGMAVRDGHASVTVLDGFGGVGAGEGHVSLRTVAPRG